MLPPRYESKEKIIVDRHNTTRPRPSLAHRGALTLDGWGQGGWGGDEGCRNQERRWWKISGSILSASRSGLEVVAPSVSEGLTGAASKRRGRLQDAAQGSDSPVSASKIWNPGALEEGGGGAPARKQ